MDKQEELILKIISLSEERMRLLNSNNNDSSLNFEKINKRINTIPLEIENLKKELYSMIEVKEEKEGILDVKLILNGGKKINIEMQNTYQEDWAERSLFYNCRMFTEGLKKGESYYELPPCIHVGILDFNYLKSPGFYHRILLKDDTTGELYSSKFQFHVIELSKIATTKGKARKQDLINGLN